MKAFPFRTVVDGEVVVCAVIILDQTFFKCTSIYFVSISPYPQALLMSDGGKADRAFSSRGIKLSSQARAELEYKMDCIVGCLF